MSYVDTTLMVSDRPECSPSAAASNTPAVLTGVHWMARERDFGSPLPPSPPPHCCPLARPSDVFSPAVVVNYSFTGGDRFVMLGWSAPPLGGLLVTRLLCPQHSNMDEYSAHQKFDGGGGGKKRG